jgi:hypothetical protein
MLDQYAYSHHSFVLLLGLGPQAPSIDYWKRLYSDYLLILFQLMPRFEIRVPALVSH